MKGTSVDRMLRHFVMVIRNQRLEVQRVAPYLGFVAKGIDKVSGGDWETRRRQLIFRVKGVPFKARYDHKLRGVRVLRVLPGRGMPDGESIATIANLDEAEGFYLNGAKLFRKVA